MLFDKGIDRQGEELKGYIQEAKKAKLAWDSAQNFFNHVSDPDLVDFAIYDIEASKRKYIYLMKKIRELAPQYAQQDERPKAEKNIFLPKALEKQKTVVK